MSLAGSRTQIRCSAEQLAGDSESTIHSQGQGLNTSYGTTLSMVFVMLRGLISVN